MLKLINRLNKGLTNIFTKSKLDAETITAFEDLLIEADLGPKLADEMAQGLKKSRWGTTTSPEDVSQFLTTRFTEILSPYQGSYHLPPTDSTQVILIVGVNGVGKTTMIGKLAHFWRSQNLSLAIAACDTYRAAAIEQLQVWANRAQTKLFYKEQADPASLAFEALATASQEHTDYLLIDTAGRLHNRQDLMASLEKLIRVLRKIDDTAPHETWLVLDATTGQNALTQAETFKQSVPLTGIIINKLDGTAKGGMVIPIAQTCQLPIIALGVGEKIEDIQSFEPKAFARSLLQPN